MYAKRNCQTIFAGVVFAALLTPAANAQNISSVGSDTLEILMERWTEEYRAENPDVTFSVESKGSGTAPPALSDGTSQLGPMSRKMKPEEVSAFEQTNGYKPTAVRVAIDALAVFVHKDNPVEGLTIAEIDAIFSSDRKCSHPAGISTWGQAGVTGALADADVSVYTRDSKSGTRSFFQKKALCKGSIIDSAKEFSTSPDLVTALAADPNGIGYSGVGFSTSDVRAVPVAKREGKDYVAASPSNAANGTYPMARFLYVYVNKAPGAPLPDHVAAFLNWVLSPAGQAIVADSGFTPLNESTVEKQVQLVSR